MLSVGVVLKLIPVMVTAVPTGPLAGLKPVIIGCALNTSEKANKTRVKIFFKC